MSVPGVSTSPSSNVMMDVSESTQRDRSMEDESTQRDRSMEDESTQRDRSMVDESTQRDMRSMEDESTQRDRSMVDESTQRDRSMVDGAQCPSCPDNNNSSQTVSCNPSVKAGKPPPEQQSLGGLRLASHAVLEKAQERGRVKCSKCGRSRMFFCYTCCALVGVSQQEIPSIKLPVKIDIIKHPNEVDGKSTAIHAKILAPDDVTIYTYPCIPEFEDERHRVVLVFPGPGSVSVEDIAQRLGHMADTKSADSPGEPCAKRLRGEGPPGATHSAEQSGLRVPHAAQGPGSGACPLHRVVFIDSTWNQTNKIVTDERLNALLKVELKTRKTCFWRHQKGSPDTYLATIEAIYYFLKDYHEQCLLQEYTGEYDNLLFFYSYLHTLVTKSKTAEGKV